MKKHEASANSVVVKQRWLFGILILVLFVISANIGITALLLYYINVTTNSIGEIQFFGHNTLIRGQVYVDQSLTTSSIKSSNQTLHFLSRGAFNIESHNDDQVTSIQIGTNSTILAEQFRIVDSSGLEYFILSGNKTVLNFRDVTLLGKAKSIKSIQTKSIVSQPSENIRLSSPTKSMSISSASGTTIASTGGDLTITALSEIVMESKTSVVHSENVFMPGLVRNFTTVSSSSGRLSAFEVCICNNGKLFVALSNQGCLISAKLACVV